MMAVPLKSLPVWLLLIAFGAAALSCSPYDPGVTTAGVYSHTFLDWYGGSLPLGGEVADLRFGGDSFTEDESAGFTLLEEIAAKQSALNRDLRDAVPPSKWRAYHVKITRALDDFEAASATARNQDGAVTLPQALDNLERELRRLRDRVVACYAQSSVCS
jgi:hypothetical protein